MSDRNASWRSFLSVAAIFGDLHVRPKYLVLHNLFFLVLTASVYFSLMPLFENRVASAKIREVSLLTKLLLDNQPLQLPSLEVYQYREGAAEALNVPKLIRTWLELHPGQVYHDTSDGFLYRLVPATGRFRRLQTPAAFYDEMVRQARFTIFGVLGILYALAVALLEFAIMPRYVYRPIRRFLDADKAALRGDRSAELIPREEIPGDEIGQIMLSRNATVKELRKRQRDLGLALEQLERTAAEIQEKNQQLESARQSLMHQDRLATLGLLSASVAHELNTPLAVLIGSIEKMAETVPQAAAQDRLRRMKRVALRLKKISESLLGFARLRREVFDRVALRPLIEEAWSLVAIDEKAAEVNFLNRVGEDASVAGDSDRLVQLFLNLIRNALHAVEPGGRIEVASRRQEGGGRAWQIVTVEDNGPGIPPEVLPEIFDAFVTTRLDARGTGLGLTVAEGIVTQHSGTIQASNRPGGGALLEVKLPVECHAPNPAT